MNKQATVRTLLWVVVSFLLMVLPQSAVRGQEPSTHDETGAEIIVVAPNVEDEPLIPGPVVAEESLSQRLFLPLVQGGSAEISEDSEVVAAFTHPWSFDNCVGGVTSANRGFWDDSPGAGVGTNNNESAFFWFRTSSTLDETCGYSAAVAPLISTSSYQTLSIRVAVSDQALFRVNVYQLNGSNCTFLTGYTSPAGNSNSTFRVYNVSLPAGRFVCRVQVTLGDNPDSINSGRASALIDEIQLRSATNGTIGWRETFSN